ncbi:MAG: DUF3592 domain-containing protein, partial [Sulfitobacter sp.]|nr:DUF3592 domain-containing protein [Sulfitobacter sp.]
SYTTYMNCGFFPKKNPTVEGIVVKSSVDKSEFERRGYSIVVNYEYQVEDKAYKSNTICCGSTANDLTKEITKKYPLGSKVTVYYRDKKPELSVLEPRIGRSNGVLLVSFGFLLLIIIIFNFYHARKN